MSLVITVATTANRVRQFRQDDQKRSSGVLNCLTSAAQLFQRQSLVIVGETSTEIYNPGTITRVEFATSADLLKYLPSIWLSDPCLRACSSPIDGEQRADSGDGIKYFDFFFMGGDQLSTLLEYSEESIRSASGSRIASIFDQPIIPYRLSEPGIGFINPANLTRTHASAPMLHPPAGAWMASDAS